MQKVEVWKSLDASKPGKTSFVRGWNLEKTADVISRVGRENENNKNKN